jgi:type I restriction enzyme, S subunit
MTTSTARAGDHRMPGRWTPVTLRSLIRPRSERNRQDLPLLSVVRSAGVIPRSYDKSENHNFIPDDLTNYKVVRAGDLVINKMKAWSGSVGVSSSDGIVSPAYFVYEFRTDVDARYMNQLLRGPAMRDEFARVSRGIRVGQWDLDPQDLKDIEVALPSLEEQQLIVRYLDNAELRIAQAIAGKNQVLSLLREAQATVIEHLILGGDEQGVSTIPTDLGSVPAHWKVLSLRGLLHPRTERNRTDLPLLSVVRSAGVIPRSYDKSENHNFIPDDLTNYKVVRAGDLVINKMKAWSGSVGVSSSDGIVSPAYFVYSLTDGNDALYMNFLFRSPQMRGQFERASRGVRVGQWDLNPQDIKAVRVPIPPMDEQLRIAARIQERIATLQEAIEGIETEIGLLREYRTKLISDVVTGKLDVREEAARMSDVDPAELATVLVGSSPNSDTEEDDDHAGN